MGDDDGPSSSLGQVHGGDGFGQSADLVDLAEQRVGRLLFDGSLHSRHVGHQQIVTHDLHAVANALHQQRPVLPIVLGQAVLDGDDGVLLHPILVESHHLLTAELAALFFEDVSPVVVDLAGGGIEGDVDILTRLVARSLDGLQDDLHGFLVGTQAGSEAALVAHAGVVALALQYLLQAVVNLSAPAQSLGEAGRAGGRDHELLQVGGIGGVLAPVEDVHQRHGKSAGRYPAHVAVKGQPQLRCRRLGHGQRDAQDGVGSQVPLVGCAIQADQ